MDVLHSARILGALLGSTPIEKSIIDDLVVANRILAERQVIDAFGHVSVRHKSSADRFLMGRALAPALVTANDIVEYDLDCEPFGVKPGFAHVVERLIDAEIYRLRGDVNAVVYTDSPIITTFASLNIPLRPIFRLAAFLAPQASILEIRPSAGNMTNTLLPDKKCSQLIAERIGADSVVLLRGHGAVVVAPSLPLAVFRAVYTEINARMQMQAMAAGASIAFLEPEEAKRIARLTDNQSHITAWEAWKHRCGGATDAIASPAMREK